MDISNLSVAELQALLETKKKQEKLAKSTYTLIDGVFANLDEEEIEMPDGILSQKPELTNKDWEMEEVDDFLLSIDYFVIKEQGADYLATLSKEQLINFIENDGRYGSQGLLVPLNHEKESKSIVDCVRKFHETLKKHKIIKTGGKGGGVGGYKPKGIRKAGTGSCFCRCASFHNPEPHQCPNNRADGSRYCKKHQDKDKRPYGDIHIVGAGAFEDEKLNSRYIKKENQAPLIAIKQGLTRFVEGVEPFPNEYGLSEEEPAVEQEEEPAEQPEQKKKKAGRPKKIKIKKPE